MSELTEKVKHEEILKEFVSKCNDLNERIKEILDPKKVLGENPMINTSQSVNGGKRSRRYKKSSKRIMRRRRGRTYRRK